MTEPVLRAIGGVLPRPAIPLRRAHELLEGISNRTLTTLWLHQKLLRNRRYTSFTGDVVKLPEEKMWFISSDWMKRLALERGNRPLAETVVMVEEPVLRALEGPPPVPSFPLAPGPVLEVVGEREVVSGCVRPVVEWFELYRFLFPRARTGTKHFKRWRLKKIASVHAVKGMEYWTHELTVDLARAVLRTVRSAERDSWVWKLLVLEHRWHVEQNRWRYET